MKYEITFNQLEEAEMTYERLAIEYRDRNLLNQIILENKILIIPKEAYDITNMVAGNADYNYTIKELL